MLRTMLDARPLVAMIVAAGVGTWGLSAYPLPMDNVFLEIMALTCNLPGVGGMRFERPVVVTETGAECLWRTPIEPWILEA